MHSQVVQLLPQTIDALRYNEEGSYFFLLTIPNKINPPATRPMETSQRVGDQPFADGTALEATGGTVGD
jgi:hypothetical protein